MTKLKFLFIYIPALIGFFIFLLLLFANKELIIKDLAILFTAIIFLSIFLYFSIMPDKFEDFISRSNVFNLPFYPKDKNKRLKWYRFIFIIVSIISFLVIVWIALFVGISLLINK